MIIIKCIDMCLSHNAKWVYDKGRGEYKMASSKPCNHKNNSSNITHITLQIYK